MKRARLREFKISGMKFFNYLILGLTSFACFSSAAGQEKKAKIGDKCLELEFEHHVSGPVPEFKDRVVFIDFWATWCGPCIASMPHVQALEEEFKDEPIQFLLITSEAPEVVEQFVKDKTLPGSVVCDTDRSVFNHFGVAGIPSGAIIGKDNRIAFIGDPREIHEADLRAILEGKPVTAKPESPKPPAPALPEGGPLVLNMGFYPGFDPVFSPFLKNGTVPKKITWQTIVRPTLVPAEAETIGGMGTKASRDKGFGITWYAIPVNEILSDVCDIPLSRITFPDSLSETMDRKFDCILSRPFATENPEAEMKKLKIELRDILTQWLSLQLSYTEVERPAVVVTKGDAALLSMKDLREKGVSLASYQPVKYLLRFIETSELAVMAENFDQNLWVDFFGFPWEGDEAGKLEWLEKNGFRIQKEPRKIEVLTVRSHEESKP